MSTTVFLAVILAALLHASWNALVKGGADKALAMAGVVIGQGVFGLPALFFVPAPDPASYPWLVAGIALHLGYQFFLLASYKIGDLTEVYPLARGSAPMIVAVVSVASLGVVLSGWQILAVALIGLGVMSMAGAGGVQSAKAVGLALVTGAFIAGYSLVDGLGAREAGTALGFYGWVALGNAVVFVLVVGVMRPELIKRVPRDGVRVTFLGGGASYAAYALVMWAFTQAPIALVTALRECSILFAVVLGVVFLGERMTPVKWVAVALVLAGVALLRLAGAMS